ncbi:MAG: agmatinase [candidate division Zixibacteria bacterium]|nr:agmatinase [candidate division Zixibacteria bacterium]
MDKITSHSYNFLGLPSEFAEFEKSEFVILPVPYEQSTTYQKGTKHAPQAIISASQEVETFDEELKFEACKAGICTLDHMEIITSGAQRMLEKVYQATNELINNGKKFVMVGGEHTISIGAVKAFCERYPNLCVLQMDAHADLRDSYQGNRFSHACVMRRIGELSPFVGVGIRNSSEEEHEFIQQNKADVFFAQDMRNHDRWKEKVLDKLGSDVYLTFDLDVLDPSIMPAVGTPEPGGLLWYETLDFLKELVYEKNLVGFDVVELCPIPGFVAPDFLAARLIYKIIGYMVSKEQKSSKFKKKNSKLQRKIQN